MRPQPVHTRRLLTYPVPGTSTRGGADESTGMAASFGDNGAPFGGGGGLNFCPMGDASFF